MLTDEALSICKGMVDLPILIQVCIERALFLSWVGLALDLINSKGILVAVGAFVTAAASVVTGMCRSNIITHCMGGILVELFSDFTFGVTHTGKMVVFEAVITLLALSRTPSIVVWPGVTTAKTTLRFCGDFLLKQVFLGVL